MDKEQLIEKIAEQIPVKDIYEDGFKPATNSTGQLLGLIPRAINAALTPLQKWILNKEYNVKETEKLLEKKLEKLNPNLITPPEPHIAVPAIQSISYCMDNENLREMYANLLASSMIKDKQNDVHPSFVEIIKQLSPDEAKILKYLYQKKIEPIINLRRENKKQQGGISIIDYFSLIGEYSNCDFNHRIPSYLENLERLKLIEIDFMAYITTPGTYDFLITHPTITAYTSITNDENYKYETMNGYTKMTNYGKNFCDICIADISNTEIFVIK